MAVPRVVTSFHLRSESGSATKSNKTWHCLILETKSSSRSLAGASFSDGSLVNSRIVDTLNLPERETTAGHIKRFLCTIKFELETVSFRQVEEMKNRVGEKDPLETIEGGFLVRPDQI